MPVSLFADLEDALDIWPVCQQEWINWCGQTAYVSRCCLSVVRWVSGFSRGLECESCRMQIKHSCQLHKIDQFRR